MVDVIAHGLNCARFHMDLIKSTLFIVCVELLVTYTSCSFDVNFNSDITDFTCPDKCRCNKASKQVDCTEINLRNVPTDIPPQVVVLLLGKNKIKTIPKETFVNLTRLSYLDLSYNNNIMLYNGSFTGLTNLTTLLLIRNGLSDAHSIPTDVFRSLNSLTHLFIYENCDGFVVHACVFHDEAIAQASKLTFLAIDVFPYGTMGPAFLKLDHLREIHTDSDFSHLVKITTDTFQNVNANSLQTLKVSRSDVRYIAPNSFSKLKQLTLLDLSENSLLCHDGIYNATIGLDKTSIKTLLLRRVCKSLWEHILRNTLVHLHKTSLEYLDLSENNILYIDVFVDLTLPMSLKYLSLRNNALANVVFLFGLSMLKNLEYLDGSSQNHYKLTNTEANVKTIGNRWNQISEHTTSMEPIKQEPRVFYDNIVPGAKMEKATESTAFNAILRYWHSHNTSNKRQKLTLPQQTHFVEYTQECNIPIPLPPNLRVLNASIIKLSEYTVPPINFTHDNRLEVLDLASIMVKGLDGRIDGLRHLKYLNFSSNNIHAINPNTFTDMPKLIELNLAGNKLAMAMSDSFENVFTQLTSLAFLDLSNNGLTWIPARTFENLTKLKVLFLNANVFRKIALHITQLKSITMLDLSNNNIEYLDKRTTGELDELHNLNHFAIAMANNSLLCNCNQKNFVRWLAETKINMVDEQNLTCSYSNDTRIRITALKKELVAFEIECQTFTVLLVCTATFFGLLMTLTFVACMYNQRWKLRYLYYIGRQTINPYHPLEETEVELNIDVYISFDENDPSVYDFVTNYLYSELELRGFRVKIRAELDDGKMLKEIISDALRHSKKMLTVLSKGYCKDFWNLFEFNIAAHEGIFTKRCIIFPVVFGTVAFEEMSGDILNFVRKEYAIKVPACIYHSIAFIDFVENMINM